jgi:hypothetical protein
MKWIKHFHVSFFFFKLIIILFHIYHLGSHTCYFILDLPAYSTAEIMYERLNYAITSCPSIDGDGIEINGPNTETIDNNDN